MKKKTTDASKKLPAVKLYLGDIEEIETDLKAIGAEVTYSNPTHEFDSLDDLKVNNPKRIQELTITASKPYISIRIEKNSVRLYSYGEPQAVGILLSLYDHLKHNSRWFTRILNPDIWFFAFIFTVCSAAFFFPIPAHKKAFLVTGSIPLILLLLSLLGRIKGFTLIYLDHKHQVLSFWERNREGIIRDIIKVTLGGALGFIIGYLTK